MMPTSLCHSAEESHADAITTAPPRPRCSACRVVPRALNMVESLAQLLDFSSRWFRRVGRLWCASQVRLTR